MNYMEYINSIQIIDDAIRTTLTTGDVDYPGTALEVNNGEIQLFDFIVNENGEKQVILYDHKVPYRISLALLEEILYVAKEKVKHIIDGQVLPDQK